MLTFDSRRVAGRIDSERSFIAYIYAHKLEVGVQELTAHIISQHAMNASQYKDTTTARGLHYRYFFSPAQQAKQTLLFCHGFPSTSVDWRYFVPFFKERGFGVVVPDLLGYGGTDKPTDASLYVSSKISKDIVDILDAEGVEKAVAIGHDW